MPSLISVRLHFPILNLTRHYYTNFKEYEGVRFTLDPIEKCDYMIVVNRAAFNINVTCPPQNIWLFFQEYGHPRMHRWMYEQHDAYSRIFSPLRNPGDSRYRFFYTPMAWMHRRTPAFLREIGASDLPKESGLTAIWGSNNILPGHKRRSNFWEYLESHPLKDIPIQLYGRGIRPVVDKWDVFSNAGYCLAIENAQSEKYWTEKIMDAYLSYTLPFYYGATTITDYFPEDSLIKIDLDDPEKSRRLIQEAISSNQRVKRLDSIREARRRVLEEHSFIPCVARMIKAQHEIRRSRLCTVKKFV